MSVASNRYAKALIDVLYPDHAEAGHDQLIRFQELLQQQPNARQFFENPTIPFDHRKELAQAIGKQMEFDKRITNFIDILIERNRLDLLAEIVPAYQRMMDDKLGILRATVTTAQPLDAAQQAKLAKKLTEATGKTIRMETTLDPSLIGGVVAQVGSTVYDGSVRQQLQAFKSSLTER